MQVTTPTELIRNSKKIFDLVTEDKETVIIHRQRGQDLVIISLDEWNNRFISPTLGIYYNKETQEAIQEAINGQGEVIEDIDDFFNNL